VLATRQREEATTAGVTVDVVVLTIRHSELSVLVVERDGPPFDGQWGLPGGFIEADEDLDVAAGRVLACHAGPGQPPSGGHLEQLRTYGAPDRDPRRRVVSVAYLGLFPGLPDLDGGAAEPGRWLPIDELAPPAGRGSSILAFDHGAMVADGVERARSKLEYSSLATAFCEEPFTLADLRRVYEIVWGVHLDVPNFRRKVRSTPGLVEGLGRRAVAASGGRPAELYRRGGARLLHPAMLRPCL
jgi:8-oxo-dGTP diphosphatase